MLYVSIIFDFFKVYFISVLYALAQLQFTAELATLYYLLGTVLDVVHIISIFLF